jgi:hypothetical protein
MSGATCAHTPNSHHRDWQEHDTIPRRAHQPRRSMSEDRRKMLVPLALIAAASPGKLRLAKYCSDGYSFMDTALIFELRRYAPHLEPLLPSKYLSACRNKRTSKGLHPLSGQLLIPISSVESSPFVERVKHESGYDSFIFNVLVIGMTPAYPRD